MLKTLISDELRKSQSKIGSQSKQKFYREKIEPRNSQKQIIMQAPVMIKGLRRHAKNALFTKPNFRYIIRIPGKTGSGQKIPRKKYYVNSSNNQGFEETCQKCTF